MTKESIEKYCKDRGLFVKVLYVQYCDYNGRAENDYWVVYTFDPNYTGEGRNYNETTAIIEPEYDALCIDEEDFYLEAK